MRLKDRVAIVTGAARGIGQVYCLALACEGAPMWSQRTSYPAPRPLPGPLPGRGAGGRWPW
jgi:hypothetical protein